jgi:hypothetical protein
MNAVPSARGSAGLALPGWRRVGALLVMLLVLAAAVAAAAETSDTGTDELLARIDKRWQRRNAHGAVPDMVALGTLVLAMDEQSYEAQWRIARAYFWIAYTHPNRLMKKALATKAVEWADRARQNQPNRVEGHYLYGIAVGQYATTVGVMTAVSEGVAKKLESAEERAYQIDRDYERGAPGTTLGRYYYSLPWPLRDLKLSRRYLEEVVQRHPDSLVARLYLAETYNELDEDELARAQLDYILAHDPAPGTELELPEPKAEARKAMKEWYD